ncbi:chondroitin sulfate glucuronyltransferase isoform X1 [Pseudoliparis swirei]|uniref:chondroitin sulfate glucuronyltransferase isoform X1 n=2 Tax=Pseudoliparis swirei TaxID=2059687 RepID=UPI0024BEBE39|nr:chondroitin sulfate glucuronyltransferase isoform X1 [Pseudoliparis swirei]
MRFSAFFSVLRSVGPVVIGISLGFTLSLLSVNWTEEACYLDAKQGEDVTSGHDGQLKGARKPNSISNINDVESEEDFEPRIVPYKQVQQSPTKKVFRAKYISTELGMRERLFVGVLTSKSTMSTLGVAVNRTISHHLDTVIFFTGMRNRKVPHGMFVVSHGDERLIWNMFQNIKYILDHYINQYDWFYFVQDDAYTEADRIKALVDHLSMDRELYMGSPEEFIGGEMEGKYCYGGFGYILSRTLLLRLQPFLENCRNDILSARPDEWLGRCIIDYTNTNCVSEYQGIQYYHYELGKNSDPSKEQSELFKKALTVHPVSDPDQMYRLHRYFTEIELQKTYDEISKLQAEIKNVSVVAFDGNRSSQWPVGISPPFEPKSRFEVLKWEYFTEEEIYSCIDGSPKCKLQGIDRMDVADVIEVAMIELNKKYKPVLHLKKQQLINGYRRFDPLRGMEYTLDLQLEVVNQKGHSRSIAKRVHLVRPLSRIEIIPMPYVTEATRIHIIIPLTLHDRVHVDHFLEVFAANAFETSENAILTFLFIYDPVEAQHVNQNDIFSSVKTQINTYERKYPTVKIPWISVKTETPSQIKFMDIISKKHPVDSLFFLANVNTNVNSEFLNRCRMNSINNWQTFFPIHFQDFNPDVAYHNQQHPATVDLIKDAGHFNRRSFEEACFYNSDYMTTRTRMVADVQENDEILETLDIFDMFLKYSGLHVFRAVEPALHQQYSYQACNPRLSEDVYHRCVQSNWEGLGSRSQLAMLLFEQEQGNST